MLVAQATAVEAALMVAEAITGNSGVCKSPSGRFRAGFFHLSIYELSLANQRAAHNSF